MQAPTTQQRAVDARHRAAPVVLEVVATAPGRVVGVQHQLVDVVHVMVVVVGGRHRRRLRRVLYGTSRRVHIIQSINQFILSHTNSINSNIKRPVFHRLPEPNRTWLLVVYFSR